jgi:hypothetical protein
MILRASELVRKRLHVQIQEQLRTTHG